MSSDARIDVMDLVSAAFADEEIKQELGALIEKLTRIADTQQLPV